VLLLDEPFGALDAKIRIDLRRTLREIQREIGMTTIFVTHDQEEAFEVADQVVVMNHGRIEQVGTPAEVFERPANPFVMDFLGNVNVFHGRVERGKAVVSGAELAAADVPHPDGQDAAVYVRPHEVVIQHEQTGKASLPATVLHVNPAGSRVKVELRATDSEQLINAELTSERFAELALRSGDVVYVSASRVRVFTGNYVI
jgi:sulfate transport system ATP-binding protein